ncbi:MAG: carbohydrate kinase [Bacteroidales bacterium]|nr:carbohydrate kinase [Bacteroidales bacterium]
MTMNYLLGIDLGSSSVKVSLVEVDSGRCAASASYPEKEAPIKALQPEWAEQRPDDWWNYFKKALNALNAKLSTLNSIEAIGITYQMHGLVCLDKNRQPLRDAIIWCDSRGVPYGDKAFHDIGKEKCLSHLLNSPGNFTASKLAWVKENEPELFDKIDKIMLPGDYLAMRLSGEAVTTACGLSEMMLYDYRCRDAKSCVSADVMNYYGFPNDLIPPLVPTFGIQGKVSAEVAKELGLKEGIPIAYRAGDQPNNALSLKVLHPGEIAATAGTSGVVYGVSDKVSYDPKSRVNTFLHVNHTLENPRLGILHCVNGCGILNSWMRRHIGSWEMISPKQLAYEDMNRIAADIPIGSDGLSILPFGNGAERVMENRDLGCSIHGLNFKRHTHAHLFRAAQEGVVFAFMYGMEVMQSLGMTLDKIHAGKANMFLSPIFRETLAGVSGATIELYDTDGSIGAARAAGLGAGFYTSPDEAFASLNRLAVIEPDEKLAEQYKEAYQRWKNHITAN